jgi:hypothetical protein
MYVWYGQPQTHRNRERTILVKTFYGCGVLIPEHFPNGLTTPQPARFLQDYPVLMELKLFSNKGRHNEATSIWFRYLALGRMQLFTTSITASQAYFGTFCAALIDTSELV